MMILTSKYDLLKGVEAPWDGPQELRGTIYFWKRKCIILQQKLIRVTIQIKCGVSKVATKSSTRSHCWHQEYEFEVLTKHRHYQSFEFNRVSFSSIETGNDMIR